MRRMIIGALAAALVACGSDPAQPSGDAGGAADAGAADARTTPPANYEPADPGRNPTPRADEGAAQWQPDEFVSGMTLLPWAERTMAFADAWATCREGDAALTPDERVALDNELVAEPSIIVYPPCVELFDYAIDPLWRDRFPSGPEAVLSDQALATCLAADRCEPCLSDLAAEAWDAGLFLLDGLVRTFVLNCQPSVYDYRELWGLVP